MVARFLILLFVLSPYVCISQDVNSYVRKAALPTNATFHYSQNDTVRVTKLIEDANDFLSNKNLKEAWKNSNEALTIARILRHKKSIAQSTFLIAKIKHQEGLLVSKNNKNTMLAQSLNGYLEALKIFEKNKNFKYSARVNFQIGLLYKDWGKFHQKAINYFETAYEQNGKSHDIAQRIKIITELCDSYVAVNNHEDVIGFQKERLNIELVNKNLRGALEALRGLSDSYQKLNNYEIALKYEKQMIGIKQELKDRFGVVNSYNNLGYLYKHMGRYTEALENFDISLTLTRKYKPTGQPTLIEKTILMNRGIIYRLLKNYKTSNKNFYDALKVWFSKGKPEEIADIYKRIAENQVDLKDYESAKSSLRQAISTTEDSKDKRFVASNYKDLSEIYQKLGDDKNALICYQLYATANDEFMSEHNQRQEKSLQQQYKINSVETEKRLAITEKEIKEIELEKKNNENELLKRETELYQRNEDIQKITLLNEMAEKTKAEQSLTILEQQYLINKRGDDNKILQQRDSINSLALAKVDLEEHQKEKDLALYKEQAIVQQLKLEEQRIRERLFYGIILAFSVIIFLAVRSYLEKKKANEKLAAQNLEIQRQKDKLEQSYENIKQLSEIGKSITSNLSIERIIETVYQNVNSLMDATFFGVGLYNEKNNRIEFPGCRERDEKIIMISFKLEEANRLAVKCFTDGETIMIGNLKEEYSQYIHEVLPSLTNEQAKSIIYIPLQVKEKSIGVITVQSPKENAYTEYHLNILRNLAVNTAIALENASNFGEIKDKTIALEKTLTDLKSAQSQLIQSEKMASLGQLTAGIAHEINNPINFVYAGIDGLKTSLDALIEILDKYEKIDTYNEIDEVLKMVNEINELKQKLYYKETKGAVHELINAVKEGAERTAEIVEGLRNFSRTNETELKTVDVHRGIESSLVLLNNKINSQEINVIKDFDSNLPEINCYPGQLNQVFMNLLNNAIEAIEGKGVINITTQNSPKQIKISISDSGIGMENEVKEKIFDPFYTTKDLGEGTGLGLSISFGIIQKHQGTLEVESKPGSGTTFTILIPKALHLSKKTKKQSSLMAKLQA